MRIATFTLALSSLALGCSHAPPTTLTDLPPKGEVWLSPEQIHEAHIQVAAAETRPIASRIITGGRIAFSDNLVSHVFSPVNGRVIKIEADFGLRVKKGQALATIESPDLGVAYSDLLKAQADLEAARHDYQRQKELYEAHAVSESLLEQATDGFHKAEAEMQRAQLKATMLHAPRSEVVRQQFVLRAPIDGEVVGRSLNPGAEIQGMLSGANMASELFTIGSLDQVWLLADLYEVDLGKVRTGDKVEISTVAYPGKTFAGTVDYVSEVLDPLSRTARVRCTIDNRERKLKPEMFVTASVTSGTRPGLALPRSALLKLGEQAIVYVQIGRTEAGLFRFAPRPVAAGDEDTDWVEILHGLASGDQVVTDGAILLSSQV
jgi:cobalt-zinc-cadmium efflux system membrane fusion protein